MPYRPCSESSRKHLTEAIAKLEERIASDERNVAALRENMERGNWYSDIDWLKQPLPEPDCYLCGHLLGSSCIGYSCALGKESLVCDIVLGKPVGFPPFRKSCPDYGHFTVIGRDKEKSK